MLAMVLAVPPASSGGGYYFAVYVPQRDAERDNAQGLAPARLLAQQQDQEGNKAAAESIYQACLSSARATHDAAWAAECKSLAEKTQQDHADCLAKLNLPKAYCDASYPARESSANCRLPDEIATVLHADLAQARYRCLREREGAER